MKQIRNTKQKEIVIEYLRKNANKHLNIQDIQNDLKDNVGLTTIYRIINSLIKDGKVKKCHWKIVKDFAISIKRIIMSVCHSII